jgi:hypothetical protein
MKASSNKVELVPPGRVALRGGARFFMPVSFLFLLFLSSIPLTSLAGEVASSDNYQLTNLSIDGGGQRNNSDNYANDGAIGMIAFRAVAQISVINYVGYTATLNNPPIAFDDILSHPFDQPLVILPPSLLQNDLDIDGDALTLFSADTSSEAHGSITPGRGDLTYTPPPLGFNGIDHFRYRVLDSAGDFGEATVTMVIAPDVQSQINDTIAIFKLSDGSYLLRFRYLKGFSEYHIETTPSLEQPWELLQSLRAGGDGVASLIIRPDGPRRFYRAVVF